MTIEAAMAAVKASPSNPHNWVDLGNAFAKDGDRDKARECYEKALSIDPTLPEARTALQNLQKPAETPVAAPAPQRVATPPPTRSQDPVQVSYVPAPNQPQYITGRVIVTDIDMPFRSMVNFIMKWMLATIPALILASVLGAFISAVAWFLFGILIRMMG